MSLDKLRHAAAARVALISTGNFDVSHVESLLIKLRGFPLKREIIRDLGDFAAHPAVRTKGTSHMEVMRFLNAFITMLERGGSTRAQPFTLSRVVADLDWELQSNGIAFESSALAAQSEGLGRCLLEIVEGAEMVFKDRRISGCRLVRKQNRCDFEFALQNPVPGRAFLGPGLTVSATLFDFDR